MLSEREVFLKKTHLGSFPNRPRLFSKDAPSSLKEEKSLGNFEIADSYECIRIFSGDKRCHMN